MKFIVSVGDYADNGGIHYIDFKPNLKNKNTEEGEIYLISFGMTM